MELDHSLSEFAAESESDGAKSRKPLRSTSTDEVAEVLARDSDAVPSVFYSEQRWIGALLCCPQPTAAPACCATSTFCRRQGSQDINLENWGYHGGFYLRHTLNQ